MKQFFKFMFASMLGMFLMSIIMFFLFMVMIFSITMSSFSKRDVVTVGKNTLLHIKLDYPINERSSTNPMENFDFRSFKAKETPGLDKILAGIKKAKDDENIKGIFLDLSYIPAGLATVEEIRNALLDFKKSGKFIISYGEYYTQVMYYLASAADKVYLNTEGMFDFKGYSATLMFFKGTLEKLEMEPQIIRHGKFKAAVEPFMLDKMSDENREQTLSYVTSMWNYFLTKVSESRKVSIADLNAIAGSIKIQFPEDAVKYKLVDKLMYKDELLAELRSRLGIGENDDIKTITIAKYGKVDVDRKNKKKEEKVKKLFKRDKIAVIYAEGNIQSGEGDERTIGSERISKAIREARLDSTVKAIVLRVNSPGGSALASEIIWREMVLAKKVKPVVASMGDVAASGGYYIACPANKIVAHPNTITGSIGVFGVLINMKDFFNNKLGITFDNVNTNEYADMGVPFRSLKPYERDVIQNYVEDIYKTFVEHVAEGRGMTTTEVDSIGQGRVWSGADAKRIGLVDEFGGIDKAIEIAAELAKLEDYKVVSLPEQKDPFVQLLEEFTGGVKNMFIEDELGDDYKYYEYIKTMKTMKGIQARMPYMIEIN